MSCLIKRLTAILCAICFFPLTAAPADAGRSPRILLMCCYQQDGWGDGSSATFLDDEGCIWRYESAAPLPDTEQARLAFLAETDSRSSLRSPSSPKMMFSAAVNTSTSLKC